jgi:hypothetical protein
MKMKTLMLIFLVAFAAASTSLALGISSCQIVTENVGFPEPYSVVHIDGNGGVEPNGDPIDTPAMPG